MRQSTACHDWESRIVQGRSLIPFSPAYPAEAMAALDIFSDLRIVDAPGSPRIADACRQWVFDFAGAVFGSYNHETGRRDIRDFMLMVSKKNSKSTIAAGLMLTALLRNWRTSAEFYIIAPTIEVAHNSYDPARDMIKADPGLSTLLHAQDHLRLITHRTTGATLQVVAAESDTIAGKKTVGLLVDELWAFGKKSNAENMLREAMGGLASRPEGFVIYATTQSDDPPAGVFKKKLDYFRAVRDGKIDDPRSLAVIYEFPQAMLEAKTYDDPANFYVTNPNLGASVDEEFLSEELTKARHGGADSLRNFFAKHLNVEVTAGGASDTWAGAGVWDRGATKGLTLDAVLDRSEVVIVAADGGGLDDLYGVAVLGREKGTRHWLHWGHALVSPEGLERRKANETIYRDFERDGDLTVVKGLPDDVQWIVDLVVMIKDRGLLAQVGVDPAGYGGLVDALADPAVDVTEENGLLIGVPQGIRLMNAAKTVERKLVDGTFRHGGSKMMAWCASNAKVRATSTAMMIERAASGFGKIDPLMAAFDAAALMALNPEASQSFWDAA